MRTARVGCSLSVVAGLLATVWSSFLSTAATEAPSQDASTIDFRYAPTNWQTSICLPDDWQKTLVGKDGALLYDYPGRFSGFGTRIVAGLSNRLDWVQQTLDSPRVPIVRTTWRSGQIEMLQEAFAVAPLIPPTQLRKHQSLSVERAGSQTVQANWAKPAHRFDPAFCNAAIGWAQPIQYRFKAQAHGQYTVLFGLCEGHHAEPGQRLLNLQIEGKTRQTVDVVAERGKNVPALYSFTATDENGDGWIDLAVAASSQSPDPNTILNVLWVFREGTAVGAEELLAGQGAQSALAHVDCGAESGNGQAPRHDLIIVRLRNSGATPASAAPILTIESEFSVAASADGHHVQIGAQTTLVSPLAMTRSERADGKLVLVLPEQTLPPGKERKLAFGIARGRDAADLPRDVSQAESLRKTAGRFWRNAQLPYDRLQAPDLGVQALIDSSIRNIYQAREIKKGLPAFQVGPTCYRGLWVVDGSFLLEAITYLGRADETRNGIKYLLSFQRDDGGIMLIDGHWKETGIALWAVTRHAKLTGDKPWLREVWPKVERAFAYIAVMREMASRDKGAPNSGLIPDGFSDGGLADKVPEYTNVYWTLAGMRAAVDAARWLGNASEAEDWRRQYDDFYAAFRRAAARDMRTDSQGRRYLPIRMAKGGGIPPQKAQWAFLHSVFPGQIYGPGDELVAGNMAMLRSVEREGLVLDTGWLKDGIWNYFASFYGHAWLWLGDGNKAAQTLYAFGNHASPLLVWREEQKPVGQGSEMVGDMPHNWASAEFIRLVRHALVLERGNELHLCEGLPVQWLKPEAVTRVRDVLTEFGPMSLRLQVSRDGSEVGLELRPPTRTPPSRIVLHLDRWSGQTGTLELPTRGMVRKTLMITR